MTQKASYLHKFFYKKIFVIIRFLLFTIGLFVLIYSHAEMPDFFKKVIKGSKHEKILPVESNSIASNNYTGNHETKAIKNSNDYLKNDSAAAQESLNLLPVPQQVSLSGQQFLFDKTWLLALESSVSKDDPAVRSLIAGLQDLFNLKIISAKEEKKN